MNNFLNGPKRFQDNPNKVYILRKNGTEFFGFDQDGEPVVISAEALFQVANIEGAVSTQSIENIEPRVTELDGKVSDHQVRSPAPKVRTRIIPTGTATSTPR